MAVNSSQEDGEALGVWPQTRILNSLVFSLRSTVRAVRNSLCDAVQVFSGRRRIIRSVSVSGTSRSKVSSADTLLAFRQSGIRRIGKTQRRSHS